MIGYLPTIPTGTSPQALWMRSVEERLRALRIQEVPGAEIQRTTRGVAIIPKPGKGGGEPAPPSTPIRQYKFKLMDFDVIICRTWDSLSNVEGDTDVIIAKPFKLRNSIKSADLDLVHVTYTYTADNVHRTAATQFDSEKQIVIPRYLPDDIIYAAKVNRMVIANADNTTRIVEWIDLNVDGRAWARKFNQQ